MKTYTLAQIDNLFGDNLSGKEIVTTQKPDRFKLIKMIDYWDTLNDNGCVNGYCSDANHNVYCVVPDPTGEYQPYKIWRELDTSKS